MEQSDKEVAHMVMSLHLRKGRSREFRLNLSINTKFVLRFCDTVSYLATKRCYDTFTVVHRAEQYTSGKEQRYATPLKHER